MDQSTGRVQIMNGSKNGESRIGSTRYFTPHSSSNWFLKIILIGVPILTIDIGAIFWWYHQRVLDAFLAQTATSVVSPANAAQFEAYLNTTLLFGFVAVIGLSVTIFALVSFLVQKITGPIFRLSAHMESIANGAPPTTVSFREGDQFQDIADTFNQMLDQLGVISDKDD